MRERLVRWFPLNVYIDPVSRQRAFSTYVIAVSFMIAILPAMIPIILVNLAIGLSAAFIVNATLLLLMTYAAGLTAISLTRSGRQALGGPLLIVAWALITSFALYAVSYPIDGTGVLVVLMMVFFISLTALLTNRAAIRVGGIVLVVTWLLIFAVRVRVPPGTANPVPIIAQFSFIVMAGIAGYIVTSWLLARGLDQTVQIANMVAARRLSLVEASSEVVKLILSRSDVDLLIKDSVGLVRRYFAEVDTAQLWLTDPDKRNITLSGNSSANPPPETQIGIGTLNPLGRVAMAGESIVVRDTPDEQQYRRNSLPVGIRSQLVLPLKIASEVIGILDLQSSLLNAFEPSEVSALQTLTNQLAIAIDNARLYATTQSSLAENKRLYEQTRLSLREIERLNQQLTGQAWSEYLKARPSAISHTYDFAANSLENFADWTPSLQVAARTGKANLTTTAQTRTASFPITVRGQVIGAMEFELDPDQSVLPDQLSALQQVIERMALSAENMRLFDEAQRIAQREAMVNEITERMQGTTSVETTIAAAAQGLAGVLKTSRVSIRISSAQDIVPGERVEELSS